MPAYRIQIVAYRYAIVQATDVLTAHKWAHNRPDNGLFGDPGFWTVSRIDDASGHEVGTLVHEDGTHTYIEEEMRNVAVLCGCGWGSLSMPEDQVPAECPVCGGPLGHG